MAFDIRCPECKAKLRLDEEPDSDTPIECPRCGSQFSAPDNAAPAPKPNKKSKGPKSKGGDKAKGNIPKKRKAIKKTVNPFLLLLMIAFAFGGLILVGAGLIWLANKTGNVEEMLTYVPDSCNSARGVNVGQLTKYPGYKAEQDKFLTSDIQWAADEFATAAGHAPEGFLSYFIAAKSRPESGNSGTMYVFRTMKAFKPDELGANLRGARENGDGSYTMSGGTGILNGAMVHMPTKRVIVVVPAGAQQRQLMAGSLAGKNGVKGSYAENLDATGRLVIRGAIWLLIRQTGGLKNYAGDSLTRVKDGLRPIYDRATKSTGMCGVWSTPGGSGVRFGVALQCESSKDAKELVKAMQSSSLGKGDESEPTNDMRSGGVNFATDKKFWSEMMQFLEYRSKDECFYIVSTVSGENNTRQILGLVNSTTMGTGGDGGGGRGGFGQPGGGGGAGGGGPAQPGMPGGIAPPGGFGR